MSLFARTSKDAVSAAAALTDLGESSAPPTERKKALDDLQAELSTVLVAVDKFVANAEAGEQDPNKRLYGKGMVEKIRKLKADVDATVSGVNELAPGIVAEFEKAEAGRLAAEEAAAKKAAAEKAAAEEEAAAAARKVEEERLARLKAEEEAAAAAAAEKERIAKQKLEEKAAAKLAAEKAAAKKAAAEAKAAADAEAARREEEAQAKASADAAAKSGIALTIKTSKGKSLAMTGLSPNMKVGDLKVAIDSAHGIPAASQRLIYQGRLLDSEKTLPECKIVAGVVIHLVENAASRTSSVTSGNAPKLKVPPGTLCHLVGGKTEFDAIVGSCGSQRLAVFDYSAPWCPPCRAIAPVYERLAGRFADVTFVKVDTEHTPANAQLAQQMSVSSYPTFHYWVAGKKVHEASGANASAIEAAVRKYSAEAATGTFARNSAGAAGSSSQSAGSGGSPSSSSALTQRVMAALGALRNNVSNDDFTVAVRTLLTFVRNVTDHPGEAKYRRVRTANNAYQSRIARHGMYGTACMQAFGFESVVENGENFLVLSEAGANNPELRVVKTQLEAAMSAAGVASGAQGAPSSAPPTGGMAGMGGMAGLPPGVNPEEARAMMQDPEFVNMASEFAQNPELLEFIMRAQAAMQSGDPAQMMSIAADPAMARVQQLMARNPSLMQRMAGQMGMGNPMAQMMGGMQGMGGNVPGAGAQAQAPTTPSTTTAAPTPPLAPTPAPAPVPGAPSTQEEEERLLQEAIRLSMQEAEKKDESKREEGGGSGNA